MTTPLPDGLGGDLILPASAYRRDRRPWLAARRRGLGASDTAAVLRRSPFRSPLDVWLEKTSTDMVVDQAPSEAAEWGTELEAVVARKVATRHPDLGKIAPTPGLLAHPEHPWMLATVDRLLVERRTSTPRVLAGLEVKTAGERVYREHWTDGVPPAHILIQVQQQLAVTGLERCYVAVLVGGQFMPEPVAVERDEDVIAAIVTYAGTWWRDHIEARQRPEITFDDKGSLTALWPGDPDADAVVADAVIDEWVRRYLRARALRDRAVEEMEQAAFEVQKALGNSTTLVDSDGHVLATWKPQISRRVDPSALREQYPEIAAAVTVETRTRVFRPKGGEVA